MSLISPLLQVFDIIAGLYYWAVIIYVVMGWLLHFGVVNHSNQFVRAVISTLAQLVEPPLRRIRRVLPMMGGLDLSPLVLILIIFLVRAYVPILVVRLFG